MVLLVEEASLQRWRARFISGKNFKYSPISMIYSPFATEYYPKTRKYSPTTKID
ncbi:hypothetical protein [Alteribacillus sp. YIM 98480]|uniref:hypothetical protein n=1 Tax=Alteribacillus sp. YIM 98480 TaxID=2606599 RepID=UPI00131C8790|nr:hypothetical protein [Alteribacillus sp. YIM 98480]